MRIVRTIVLAAGLMALILCNAEENARVSRILDLVCRIHPANIYPGTPAMSELEKEKDLVAVLCQNWDKFKDPERRASVLDYVVCRAHQACKSRRYWYRLNDETVAKALVQALDDEDPSVREYEAAGCLLDWFHEDVVRSHTKQILSALEHHPDNVKGILLLGRTASVSARDLLRRDGRFVNGDFAKHKVDVALAKLGDQEREEMLIKMFNTENAPKSKASLADELGYIGSEKACKALAMELRSALRVGSHPEYSFRVLIIRALSRAYPDNELLREPEEKEVRKLGDLYYDRIEKWAEQKFSIAWKEPRPDFFYMMGTPGRPHHGPGR